MFRHVVCPYCYERISPRQLWFQCSGMGSATQNGCVAREDPTRTRLAGLMDNMLPAFPPAHQTWLFPVKSAWCPNCDGKTGRRACPNCHMPLAPDFGKRRSPFIAMVGAKGTGKTIYLTVLAEELRRSIPDRFDADIRLTDAQGGIKSQWHWVEDNLRMFQDGVLFEGTTTAIDGRRETLVFEWRAMSKQMGRTRYPITYISFSDTAGEDLTTQLGTQSLRYLGAADALIVLLDPFNLPGAASRLNLPEAAIINTEATADVLNRVTKSLRESHGCSGNQRIKIPVAVAFAKTDELFDNPDLAQVRATSQTTGPWYDERTGDLINESVKAFLFDWNGRDIHRHLEHNYENFRYFFVSALGSPPDYVTSTFRGTVAPYRVEEPLVWLLSRFNLIPVKGK